MPKSKGKNTDEGEGNVAEGLVDLRMDDEKDKKKFLEIINEEEKHVKEFIQRSNKEILESECDELVLVYSHSADVGGKRFKTNSGKEGHQISTKERKESANQV